MKPVHILWLGLTAVTGYSVYLNRFSNKALIGAYLYVTAMRYVVDLLERQGIGRKYKTSIFDKFDR